MLRRLASIRHRVLIRAARLDGQRHCARVPASGRLPRKRQTSGRLAEAAEAAAAHQAPGSATSEQSETWAPSRISARRLAAYLSAASLSSASSVRIVDQARYDCGPPQALAPSASVRHWSSRLQAASPISLSTSALSAALSGSPPSAQATATMPVVLAIRTQSASRAFARLSLVMSACESLEPAGQRSSLVDGTAASRSGSLAV